MVSDNVGVCMFLLFFLGKVKVLLCSVCECRYNGSDSFVFCFFLSPCFYWLGLFV